MANVNLEPTAELLERLVGAMDRHHLRTPVERRISLEESPAALAELRMGKARGKTVIRLEPNGNRSPTPG
jgi:NADPH:quinone reductase-like Zn-dependent oxidoreductase